MKTIQISDEQAELLYKMFPDMTDEEVVHVMLLMLLRFLHFYPKGFALHFATVFTDMRAGREGK